MFLNNPQYCTLLKEQHFKSDTLEIPTLQLTTDKRKLTNIYTVYDFLISLYSNINNHCFIITTTHSYTNKHRY